jgi:3alpha(or 20beta)-hydroxysteroid dehydrogenase
MDGRIGGKVALVTGAAQGIGEAIARKFVEHGATVVIADIKADGGRRLADELGPAATFQRLDVRQQEDWEATVSSIASRFGRLDILVNNAGTAYLSPIELEEPDNHRRILDLNVTGVWMGIRTVVPAMAAQGGGSIVNISSIDGLAGMANLSTYVASKFAVTGMTRSLAMELGGRGIRVNSIHPGIIQTPLVPATGPTVEMLRRVLARQPIPRIGRPEEIANAVLFFASDESSYCTGASLVVDGGHLAGPPRDPPQT